MFILPWSLDQSESDSSDGENGKTSAPVFPGPEQKVKHGKLFIASFIPKAKKIIFERWHNQCPAGLFAKRWVKK